MTAIAADQLLEAPRVPLAEIHHHPLNPRINAVADEEMVESIRQHGVIDPVMVAPAVDGDGWVLIDGHRRDDGARRAGLVDVPVNPRYDLVTEAQQVEVMAITGLQKQLLTPVEEAAAYEQLTLLGFDVDSIATSLGFSKARVKSRMRLNDLGDGVRSRLHEGQFTLADAEAMLEFADDPAATAELEESLGTTNFRFRVQEARGRRDRAAEQRDTIAAYETQGATKLEKDAQYRPLGEFTDEDLNEVDAHTVGDGGCLRWRMPAPFGSYAGPYLVCSQPGTHSDAPTPGETRAAAAAERESEWEKRREERAAQYARHLAASRVRLAWLVEHFTAMFTVRSHRPLAAAAQALIPIMVTAGRDTPDATTLARAFGIEPAGLESAAYYSDLDTAQTNFAADMRTANPTRVLAAFSGVIAAFVADELQVDSTFLEDPDEIQRHLVLWDWLRGAGYDLSDVDVEIRTRLETKLVEVTTEGGDA